MNCQYSLPDPIDLTCNGVCSQCGGCCSSLIPITDQELTYMRRYADKISFKPEIPNCDPTVIYLKCPFLDAKTNACAIYPARPDVCRAFSCHNSTTANMAAYQAHARVDKPNAKVQNVWKAYNLTGLRIEGRLVKYSDAPRAVLTTDQNESIIIQAGAPVTIQTTDHKLYANVMCVDLSLDTIIIFDPISRKITPISYQKIERI